MNKPIIILGGGTFYHVRNHLSIAAPAFGTTAKWLHEQLPVSSEVVLTRMADNTSTLETNKDVSTFMDYLLAADTVKCIVMNIAMCDYDGQIEDVTSDKHAQRLRTSEGVTTMRLTPSDKVISGIKKVRPDIFLVGFKTTTHHTPAEQKQRALDMLEKSNCDLVFANDTLSRNNMLISKEGKTLITTQNRTAALSKLVQELKNQNF